MGGGAGNSSDKRVCIWIIDDNPADVFLFREAIQSAELDAELLVINDGSKALAVIERAETPDACPVPHLAVVDLNLPKADGIEVLEALRRSRHFPDVPVMITSSSISPVNWARMQQLRVDRFFIKPSTLEEFTQVGVVLKEMLYGDGNRK
jgi:CheY-like chemotaxis protein